MTFSGKVYFFSGFFTGQEINYSRVHQEMNLQVYRTIIGKKLLFLNRSNQKIKLPITYMLSSALTFLSAKCHFRVLHYGFFSC